MKSHCGKRRSRRNASAPDLRLANRSRHRPLACLALAAAAVLIHVARASAAGAERELWVEVRINRVTCPDFALLRIDSRGALFVRSTDITAWHLHLPGVNADPADADARVRIDNVAGLHAKLDARNSQLQIDADASLFAAQLIQGARHSGTPDHGVPAFFADYDLFAQGSSHGSRDYSAHLEFGTSLGRASLVSSWLASYGDNGAAPSIGQTIPPAWSRLDTALLLDWPEHTARLTIGDSITEPGTLGQTVRFSGIHWATDYATQPGLTPYALPVVSGTATLPSSIELYLNQSLLERSTVDPGPFELHNLPVPVGQGDVSIRIRDILGRDQLLSVPYLVSPELLAPGLTLTDYSAGAVRRQYGLANFDYGSPFVTAAIRHGQTEALTYNASAEVLADQLTARFGTAVRMASNVTVALTPAASHSVEGNGTAIDAGVNSLFGLGQFAVNLRAASRDFVELGSDAQLAHLHTEWAAQASTQLHGLGSLALIYARRTAFDAPETTATTLNYNLTVRAFGAFGAFISRTQGSSNDLVTGLMFTRSLGGRTSASIGFTRDDGATTVNTRVSAVPPPDAGWGWDIATTRGATDSNGLRLEERSAYGVATGEIDSTNGSNTGIFSWQGGVLWTGNRTWLGQSLSAPAALVELPDLSRVRVLHDGQPAGETDDQGRLLVVGLRPFEDNVLRLVQEDLPLTAIVPSDSIVVRPYSRGVVEARFPVDAASSATIVLQLDAAGPVPAGARIVLGTHTLPVGRDGLAQIPVLKQPTQARVTWPGGECRVHLPVSRNPAARRVVQCTSVK